MPDLHEHILQVEHAAREWLRPDNRSLQRMIEKSLHAGLFSFNDIRFQLRVLKQKIDAGQISTWAVRAGLSENYNNFGTKVLCLHAGNLPLVGFQDALGLILSGADYFGKLSRKDPYLLRSFLVHMENVGLQNTIRYSINLDDFKQVIADKAYFAGAESSIQPVKEAAKKINAVSDSVEWVIRRAKFSLAYLPDENPETMKDLTEAVFRYGGLGCRSVAVVVSPITLKQIKCEFQDYLEAFWLRSPQFLKPKPILEYQFAYNKAVRREQAWMQDFLIHETQEFPELDFTLNWVTGGEEKLRELASKFGPAVQNIYTPGLRIDGLKTEFLSKSQSPDLWWKPDGLEVI